MISRRLLLCTLVLAACGIFLTVTCVGLAAVQAPQNTQVIPGAKYADLLWAKNNGYWKIISYDLEPEFEKYRVPDTTSDAARAAAAVPPVVYVA